MIPKTDWDGSVHPHFSQNNKKSMDYSSFLFGNLSMRSGIVTAIYYPEDVNNTSKKEIEYDVLVLNKENQSVTFTKFRGCVVSNMFGMTNNSLSYTLQAGEKDEKGFIKNGSMVLILCLNGSPDANQAMIIGGLQHPDQKTYSSADGQFYDFTFNGMNYNINKDGELTITFSGNPDLNNPQDNPAAPTVLKFDKDGGFTISDNEQQSIALNRTSKTITVTNGSESIVIDKENKKISLNSGQNIETSSEQDTKVSAQQNLDMSAQQNATVQAEQNLNLNANQNVISQAGQNWQIQAGSNVTVSSQGSVIIQAPTVIVQGDTTLLGAAPTAPVALAGVSQIIAFLGPVPLPGNIITGSTTVLGSP